MKIYLNKEEYKAFIKFAEEADDNPVLRELYHTSPKRFALEELLFADVSLNPDYIPDAALEIYQE